MLRLLLQLLPLWPKARSAAKYFFCAFSLGAQRLEQMAVKCAEYIDIGFSFLLWHHSEHV
jgi:hypothetical protein